MDIQQNAWGGASILLAAAVTASAARFPMAVGSAVATRHACISEGAGLWCVRSLAPHREADLFAPFASRADADSACADLGYDGLVHLTTGVRQALAARVVDSLGVPHWIGGDDSPNGVVTWRDGTPHAGFDAPWHSLSGQPNDCDGPGTETCMFMGPNGKWFDFACAPKVPQEEPRVTAGPEIDWHDTNEKVEYSVWPLCGGNVVEEEIAAEELARHHGEAEEVEL